ncbi:MAG: group II intron maturase-specific domain-containing protein [Coprobacillaceae bacterium]
MKELKEKLKILTKRSWSVSWEYRCQKIRQLVVGWINYYKIFTLFDK